MTEKQKDILWSKAVRDRDRHRCRLALPGCMGKATDACHIFSRRFKVLRHNTDNGLAGCRVCHSWSEVHSEAFEILAKRLIGEEKWNELTQILFDNYGIRR